MHRTEHSGDIAVDVQDAQLPLAQDGEIDLREIDGRLRRAVAPELDEFLGDLDGDRLLRLFR